MKLQLALDLVTKEQAIECLTQTMDFIDIVEIGTPFIIREGINSIREIHNEFPQKPFLADVKIMDGGKPEATYAFEAGADIVTVLGVAEDATILNVIEVAKHFGKKVMVDMIAVPDIEKRTEKIDRFGADYICVHTAFDIQHTGKSPLEELEILKKVIQNSRAAVAGGINAGTINEIVRAEPEIIVVGGAIVNAKEKKKAAAAFHELLSQN